MKDWIVSTGCPDITCIFSYNKKHGEIIMKIEQKFGDPQRPDVWCSMEVIRETSSPYLKTCSHPFPFCLQRPVSGNVLVRLFEFPQEDKERRTLLRRLLGHVEKMKV